MQFVSNRFVFDFKSLSSVNLVITESSFAQVTFIHDCVSDFKLRFWKKDPPWALIPFSKSSEMSFKNWKASTKFDLPAADAH